MLKDYDTPNFKTPPKKSILTSSKSALRATSNPNLPNEEISLEEIDMKIYELVNTALKSGHPPEKIDEIKEKAYQEIIKSLYFIKLSIFI